MKFRTQITLAALLALLAYSLIFAPAATAATTLDAATMKAALRTATIEEGGFIDNVVTKVNKGILPVSMVDSTFQWARKKPDKHRFQYFKQALIVRAANIGVKI